jgi:hypothetical protein
MGLGKSIPQDGTLPFKFKIGVRVIQFLGGGFAKGGFDYWAVT